MDSSDGASLEGEQRLVLLLAPVLDGADREPPLAMYHLFFAPQSRVVMILWPLPPHFLRRAL